MADSGPLRDVSTTDIFSLSELTSVEDKSSDYSSLVNTFLGGGGSSTACRTLVYD